MTSYPDDSLIRHLTKTKEQVEFLLETYPATRDNDFYLQWLWLKIFGKVDLPWLEYAKIEGFCGRLDTLSRVRRTIQNTEGRFPPTKATRIRRQNKQGNMRDAFGKDLDKWSGPT